MKVPLSYQKSEYDCGPTTMLNALSYLFECEEIPPDIIKYIMIYTLDTFDEQGHCGKHGTSKMAMMFLSSWLNQYANMRSFPIHCEYVSGDDVCVETGGQLMTAVRQGGVAVVRLMYDCWHYVLITGECEDGVLLFDPYYHGEPFEFKGISIVEDCPKTHNRCVDRSYFRLEGDEPFALGEKSIREAVLVFNTAEKCDLVK